MSDDFPDRPDHPDFWLISEAVLDMDARSESGQKPWEILGRMIDPDSVMYAAVQRAQHAAVKLPLRPADPDLIAALAGAWTDGVMTGMRVQQAKARQEGQ